MTVSVQDIIRICSPQQKLDIQPIDIVINVKDVPSFRKKILGSSLLHLGLWAAVLEHAVTKYEAHFNHTHREIKFF
jgi:hypothetical protein